MQPHVLYLIFYRLPCSNSCPHAPTSTKNVTSKVQSRSLMNYYDDSEFLISFWCVGHPRALSLFLLLHFPVIQESALLCPCKLVAYSFPELFLSHCSFRHYSQTFENIVIVATGLYKTKLCVSAY